MVLVAMHRSCMGHAWESNSPKMSGQLGIRCAIHSCSARPPDASHGGPARDHRRRGGFLSLVRETVLAAQGEFHARPFAPGLSRTRTRSYPTSVQIVGYHPDLRRRAAVRLSGAHQASGAARVRPTLAGGRGALETVSASWLSTGARGTE